MTSKVLASFEDLTHTQCVDIFVRANGTYGFEAFRADLDTGIGWRSLGQFSHRVFPSGDAALQTVKALFPWVDQQQVWRW